MFQSLRLSNAARKTTTVGEIVNLMSVDTEKIVMAFQTLHFVWSAPLVLGVSLYFQVLLNHIHSGTWWHDINILFFAPCLGNYYRPIYHHSTW